MVVSLALIWQTAAVLGNLTSADSSFVAALWRINLPPICSQRLRCQAYQFTTNLWWLSCQEARAWEEFESQQYVVNACLRALFPEENTNLFSEQNTKALN